MIEPARISSTRPQPPRVKRVSKGELISTQRRNSFISQISSTSTQVRVQHVKKQKRSLNQNIHQRIITASNPRYIKRYNKVDSATTDSVHSVKSQKTTRSCNFEFKRLSRPNLGSFRKIKSVPSRFPSVRIF